MGHITDKEIQRGIHEIQNDKTIRTGLERDYGQSLIGWASCLSSWARASTIVYCNWSNLQGRSHNAGYSCGGVVHWWQFWRVLKLVFPNSAYLTCKTDFHSNTVLQNKLFFLLVQLKPVQLILNTKINHLFLFKNGLVYRLALDITY